MSLNHGLHSPKPHVHAPSFSTSTIPSGFSFGVNQSTSRTKRSREEDDEDDIILQHPSSSRGYEHDTSHLELDEEEEIREQEDDMETSDPYTSLTSQALNHDGTPKRPMNAFMIFARRRRPQVSSEHPSMRTGEISKILSKEWQSMDKAAKQFYLDNAKKLKDNFNLRWPDYVYKRRPNNSRKRRRNSIVDRNDDCGDLTPSVVNDGVVNVASRIGAPISTAPSFDQINKIPNNHFAHSMTSQNLNLNIPSSPASTLHYNICGDIPASSSTAPALISSHLSRFSHDQSCDLPNSDVDSLEVARNYSQWTTSVVGRSLRTSSSPPSSSSSGTSGTQILGSSISCGFRGHERGNTPGWSRGDYNSNIAPAGERGHFMPRASESRITSRLSWSADSTNPMRYLPPSEHEEGASSTPEEHINHGLAMHGAKPDFHNTFQPPNIQSWSAPITLRPSLPNQQQSCNAQSLTNAHNSHVAPYPFSVLTAPFHPPGALPASDQHQHTATTTTTIRSPGDHVLASTGEGLSLYHNVTPFPAPPYSPQERRSLRSETLRNGSSSRNSRSINSLHTTSSSPISTPPTPAFALASPVSLHPPIPPSSAFPGSTSSHLGPRLHKSYNHSASLGPASEPDQYGQAQSGHHASGLIVNPGSREAEYQHCRGGSVFMNNNVRDNSDYRFGFVNPTSSNATQLSTGQRWEPVKMEQG